MKILIAADFVPQGDTTTFVEHGQYDEILSEIIPYTKKVDFSVINLEAPVIQGVPTPIVKSGPNLYCREKTLDAIKYAGFRCVTLANNHFYDQGENGVKDTLSECRKRNIEYVGGGKNLEEASKSLYEMINGEKVAIINCCEKEFSIADGCHGGSNPMDPIRIYNSIVEARNKSDYVLVITHGGIEHYQYPYPQMQELYRFFIDAGADAVVNHHQHCPSGYEYYKGKPILYGLGNFCFESNGEPDFWYEGYMVELHFEKHKVKFEIYPYRQSLNGVGIRLLKGDSKDKFINEITKLSQVISDQKQIADNYRKFIDGKMNGYILSIEPNTRNIIRKLQYRRYFPLKLSIKQLYVILNLIRCQSHHANLMESLQQYLTLDTKRYKHRKS